RMWQGAARPQAGYLDERLFRVLSDGQREVVQSAYPAEVGQIWPAELDTGTEPGKLKPPRWELLTGPGRRQIPVRTALQIPVGRFFRLPASGLLKMTVRLKIQTPVNRQNSLPTLEKGGFLKMPVKMLGGFGKAAHFKSPAGPPRGF